MLIRGIVTIAFVLVVRAANESDRVVEPTTEVLNRTLDIDPGVLPPSLCFLILGDWVST